MKGRSKRPRRPTKRTVLIECEGKETERNYFDGLKRTDEVTKHYSIRVIPGKGGSRLQIVGRAVKRQKKREYDEYWCVFDTERLDNPETRKDFENAVQLAADNKLNLAISNPSFEVWLVAHFERTSKSFSDSDAVENYLNVLFKKEFNRDYAKNDKDLFARLRDRQDIAIDNVAYVRTHDHGVVEFNVAQCNSSTTVDELVIRLKSDPKKKTS